MVYTIPKSKYQLNKYLAHRVYIVYYIDMSKDTTVIVDHGSSLFGTYTAGFFCTEDITVENIVAEISKRLGIKCTTTGYDETYHSVYVLVPRN